jgi:hypothetical protein
LNRFGTLRVALVSGVAFACLAGMAAPADAAWRRASYYQGYGGGWFSSPADVLPRRGHSARRGGGGEPSAARREKPEPKKDPGFGEMPKGPQQIVVNISTQKVTLYANGERVAQGPVSTGVPGHPTPMGVFSIIEKDRYHHSNIYSGAPMPFMQRITWSGVALHEGVLPGYPASHGCIRMSHDFAQKLWPVTKLGVRVIVSRHNVEPVEFQHAKLFVPKPKPPEPSVASTATTDGAHVRFAQATPDAAIDATVTADPPKPAAEVTAPKNVEPNLVEPKAAETAAPAEATKPAEDMKAVDAVKPVETTDEPSTGTVKSIQPAAADTVPVAPPDLRKSVEAPPAPVKPPEVVPAAAPAPTQATPANEIMKPAPTVDPVKPVAPRTKNAVQPAKPAGQVAVFVSRKEKKIYVRQGNAPLFDMPITIDEPDQPLGTHVFTAMQVTNDGAGMRWNLMTVPTDPVAMMEDRGRGRKSKEPPKPVVQVQHKPTSTAAEALNRIQFPQEAVDRISEILIPGSSLIVSDAGTSHETGRGTEFIILTR